MKKQKRKFLLGLLPMLCSACNKAPLVKEPYPLWGEEIYLQQQAQKKLHMQLLDDTRHQATGCLLMVHGMNEYIGRYQPVAEYFAKDFIIAGVDLSAHGLSNAHLRRAHQYVSNGMDKQDAADAYLEQAQLATDLEPMREDLHQALEYLLSYCDSKLPPDTPLFMLTHSLGSLVSASYLLQHTEYRHRIKGIIFAGPAFSVTEVPGWRGNFQTPFIRFSFHIHRHFLHPADEPLPTLLFNQGLSFISVPLFDGIIKLFSLPGIRVLFSPSTPEWVPTYLSDWEEERQRHHKDGYIIRRSILSYVQAVEREIIRFRRQMQDFDIPYLLIYSEKDPITPAWGNEDFAGLTLKKHPDNQLMPLIGANHHEQLFSSPALQRKVLQKIDDWLKLRLGSLKERDE